MLHIQITAPAKADLSRIKAYTVKNFGEPQALTYMNALYEGFETIQSHPKIGFSVSYGTLNLHTYQIEHHRIFYRIEHGLIIVLAVLHERQVPSRQLLGRLG